MVLVEWGWNGLTDFIRLVETVKIRNLGEKGTMEVISALIVYAIGMDMITHRT